MCYNIFHIFIAFMLGANTALWLILAAKELPAINWHKKYQEVDTCKCEEVDRSAEEKLRWREYDESHKVDKPHFQETTSKFEIAKKAIVPAEYAWTEKDYKNILKQV